MLYVLVIVLFTLLVFISINSLRDLFKTEDKILGFYQSQCKEDNSIDNVFIDDLYLEEMEEK